MKPSPVGKKGSFDTIPKKKSHQGGHTEHQIYGRFRETKIKQNLLQERTLHLIIRFIQIKLE